MSGTGSRGDAAALRARAERREGSEQGGRWGGRQPGLGEPSGAGGHWGSARMVAPGSAPACSGREQPGWMDGAEGSLWGFLSGTPLRWVRGLSGGCDASGWGGPGDSARGHGAICENSPHPCSMRIALSCLRARLDSWNMEPQNPLSCPGPAVPSCCQRQS